MGVLVGAGSWRRDSLWDLDWLRLPSATATSLSTPITVCTDSFQQCHHCLGYLCGSSLLFLVHRGVLGSV
jgi:hypothetical protein